jgi:thioredoxin-dependent peroxiredoxin
MTQLKPGDNAPDFSAMDQNGKSVHLADFRGRKVFVYFFPKAHTSG